MESSEEKPTQSAWANWRSYPATIIGGTIVGTLLFAQSVLVPVETADLRAQIGEFSRKEKEAPQLEKKILALQNELDATKATLHETRSTLEKVKKEAAAKLAVAQLTHLFEAGSPYPVGLSQVRLGDDIEAVAAAYAAMAIAKKSSYWSVKTQHSQFYNVTYYFGHDAKTKSITHMLLFFNRELPVSTLSEKFLEAFGRPTFQNNICRYWKFSDNLFAIQTINPDLPIDDQLTNYVIDSNPFRCRQR